MNKKITLGLFFLLVLFQLGTPLAMIVKRESVLKTGEHFRFKTAPVDPYDAFRGRYVALRLEADRVPVPEGLDLNYGQKVYAHIVVDEKGFAKFSTVSIARPEGIPYIEASGRIQGKNVQLDLPIDRYYMEEKAAPAAEKLYRKNSTRDKQNTYVTVRVKDGYVVIEGLYISGQKIEDAIKNGS